MKKTIALLLALFMLSVASLALAWSDGVTAISCGKLYPVSAAPNQKLAFRSGPGTHYTELFSFSASSVDDFAIYTQEKGNSVMWGMVEFTCYKGRYRLYTGMKRIDAYGVVPYGNPTGVSCYVGSSGANGYYGPGYNYVALDKQVPAWTPITVYHEEQGFVLADFVMPGAKAQQRDKSQLEITRAWLPIHMLSGYVSYEAQYNWNDDGWYDDESDNEYDDWYNDDWWNGQWEEVG